MILAPVKFTLVTRLAGEGVQPSLTWGTLPERLAGTGRFRLMGIKGVAFRVHYSLVVVRVVQSGALGADPGETEMVRGKVGRITREDGRRLPEGTYSLDDVPGCRFTYFGQRWTMHFG